MRITAKGQVTIPQEIRRRLGLHSETDRLDEAAFRDCDVTPDGQRFLLNLEGGAAPSDEVIVD